MGKEKRAPSWAKMPPRSLQLYLQVDKGDARSKHSIADKPAYLIGRNRKECDIVCEHKSCSRVHACIAYHTEEKAYIVDMGSAHGTVVDGRQLEPECQAELIPGKTKFTLGSCSWIYCVKVVSDRKPSGKLEGGAGNSKQVRGAGDREYNVPQQKRQRVHIGSEARKHDYRKTDEEERRDDNYRGRYKRQDDYRSRESQPERDKWRAPEKDQIDAARGSALAQAPVTFAQQKKKLLWGKPTEAGTGEPEKDVEGVYGANRWDTAKFDNAAEREKFIKLMGVHNKPKGDQSQAIASEREVLTGDKQIKVLSDVETHFMQGLRRADGRKVGLGL